MAKNLSSRNNYKYEPINEKKLSLNPQKNPQAEIM